MGRPPPAAATPVPAPHPRRTEGVGRRASCVGRAAMSEQGAGTDELPPGWAYNPSAWGQRIPIVVLGIGAMLVAFYLAAYQFGWVDSVWDPFFGDGTEEVLDSDLSHLFPVSDALLGSVGYFVDWVFGLVGGTRRWKTMPWTVVVLGIGIIPFGFTSVALALAMPSIVGSWCFLCLVNTVVAVVMIPFAWDEIWLALLAMGSMMRNGATFWGAFTGSASHLAFRGEEAARA